MLLFMHWFQIIQNYHIFSYKEEKKKKKSYDSLLLHCGRGVGGGANKECWELRCPYNMGRRIDVGVMVEKIYSVYMVAMTLKK